MPQALPYQHPFSWFAEGCDLEIDNVDIGEAVSELNLWFNCFNVNVWTFKNPKPTNGPWTGLA